MSIQEIAGDIQAWAQMYASAEGPSEGGKPDRASSKGAPRLNTSKETWNAKAHGFANKNKRSPYIGTLIDMLDLREGETVLDIGCGPGTLALPLAKAGFDVTAIDFSPAMLAELEVNMAAQQEAGNAGSGSVTAIERSWQDPWDDIDCVDVAVSSRSLIVDNVVEALAKMEQHARRLCAVTLTCGQAPWMDVKLWHAIGRDVEAIDLVRPAMCVVNILMLQGKEPQVRYIHYIRRRQAESIEKLVEVCCTHTEGIEGVQRNAAEAFVREHAEQLPDGTWQLDYDQKITWALITWQPEGAAE